tara:strand:- start:705 stop:1229 length:525 start_codon:yes stop_codon:yes gene_type:complete
MKKLTLTLFLTIPLAFFGQKDTDIQGAIKAHNEARKEVGVSGLIWSSKLENDAAKYAQYLAKRDKGLVHSKSNNNQGENLYSSYSAKTTNGVKSYVFSETPLKDASIAWYNEIKDYKYSKIKKFRTGPMIGHYTQMVWKNTKEVGMASAISKDGKVYVVARYYPAGNYIGEFPY